MLRAMHSFIFSKLRIMTHRHFFVFDTHYKDLASAQEERLAVLEAWCQELELTHTTQMTALKAHYQGLVQNQDDKLAALAAYCQKLEQTQNEKILAIQESTAKLQQQTMGIKESSAKLQRQTMDVEAIQNGLTAAIGLNCRSIGQLLQKNEISVTAPYLESPLLFEEQLQQLKALEPAAFDLWWQCFLNGQKEYERTIEGNLSYGAHSGAALFNAFITPLLKGNVLDIGCGPQLLPSYLNGAIAISDIHLVGIDPLYGAHPFVFYHGFAEFLPWQSNCFDVVICATSLDHCLSLSKTIDEIKRVLKPGGKLLIWVGFISGATVYEPKSSELRAVDAYHLFHFDRPWFESLLTSDFNLIECLNSEPTGYFYSFGA